MIGHLCLAVVIAWTGLIALGIIGFARAMGRPTPAPETEPSAAPEAEQEKERTA